MVKHEFDNHHMRSRESKSHFHWIAPMAVFAVSLVLYWKTMAPSIFWGDSAAFAASNYILGLPHSPSFPLYTLMGRVFALVPYFSPAFMANLMSAVFASLAVLFFFLIVRRFLDIPVFQEAAYKKKMSEIKVAMNSNVSGREVPLVDRDYFSTPRMTWLPALAMTALFALSLPVWLSAVRAEVYSLHLFLTLAAIFFTFKGIKEFRQRLLFLGGWLYILSFANHPLLALAFAPAFLFVFLYNISKIDRKYLSLFVFGLMFIAGLSIYFYLPFRSALDPAINWGRPNSLSAFFAAITRSSDLANVSGLFIAPDYVTRFKNVAVFLSTQIGWPLIAALVFGLWGMAKVSGKSSFFFTLALLFNLAIVVWAADFNYRNYDLVNYLAPLVAVILIISVSGLMYLMRTRADSSRVSILFSILIGVFVYLSAAGNYTRANMKDVKGPDILGREICKELPPGSILMVAEDDVLLPLWYCAYVDSLANEINILSPGAMVNPAYRKQLMINYPDLIYPADFGGPDPGHPESLAVQICRANFGHREIFVQFGVPGISHSEVEPHGILFRYKGAGKKAEFDKLSYKKNLGIVGWMLEGNMHEAQTVEFCGRWLFTQGVYYERIGRREIAGEFFKKALDTDRESIDLRIKLASGLARAGNYKSALQYIAQALEIDSKNPEALRLGQEIIKALDGKEAVAHR